MTKNNKSFFEQLIETYHNLNKQLESSIRSANQNYREQSREQVYTEEHLQNKLNKAVSQAMQDFMTQAAALNAQARQQITITKEKLVKALTLKEKPMDYAVRISNALAFLRIEGQEITDETASQILRDFLGDAEIMQRFRSVIERQKGDKLTDAYGRTTFPLTFGQLERYEMLLEAVAELERTAAQLFVHKKAETEVDHRNGVKLFIPVDGYSQQVGELNILQQAETVQTMAEEVTGTANKE